jgi:hypothetical protein
MVKNLLVERSEVEGGGALVEALRNAEDLRLEAALWEITENGDKRLVLGTPLVYDKGRRVAYKLVHSLLQNQPAELRELEQYLDMRSPTEGIVKILDMASGSGRLPLNRWIEGEMHNGFYLEGLYIYFFDLKTVIEPAQP